MNALTVWGLYNFLLDLAAGTPQHKETNLINPHVIRQAPNVPVSKGVRSQVRIQCIIQYKYKEVVGL